MAKREWVPAAGLALLICIFAARGRLDVHTLAVMLLVPLALLGQHYRERWSSRSRSAFLAFLVVTTSVFVVTLIVVVLRNVEQVPEWDFVGFWLHARTAVLGQSFYDPRNAQELAATMQLSETFRREIVDVGFWYPPASMFVFWPLGFFDPPTALALWSVLQLAAMVGSIALLRKRFFLRGGAAELLDCTTLVGAAYGTWRTFEYSQTTFLALLALLLVWPRPNSAIGGVWMAVAGLVKPFLFALALVPLLARRWCAVLSLALSILALSLVAVAAFGIDTFVAYLTAGPVGAKPDWIFSESTNQSLLGLILRRSHSEHCAPACISNPTFLIVATVIGAVTLLVSRSMARTHPEWAMSIWLLFALLVYPASQVCYSILLIPVMLLFWRDRRRIPGGPWAVAMSSGAIYGLMLVDGGRATVVAYSLLWLLTAVIGTRTRRWKRLSPVA